MPGFGNKGFAFSKSSTPSTASGGVGGGFSFKKPATGSGGFGSSASSGSGFGANKQRVDPETAPEEPTTILHDIANASSDLADKLSQHSVVTLKLTNATKLTTMPTIEGLPRCVQKVEFAESCACITDMEHHNVVTGFGGQVRGFLRKCKGLHEIDLSGMPNLQHFGNYFASCCDQLESVTFCSTSSAGATQPQPPKTVGCSFLANTPKLKRVSNLSYFANLQTIPSAFLMNTGLEEVVFPAMPRLHTIEDNFLCGCYQLKHLIFTPQTADDAYSSSAPFSCSIKSNFLHSSGIEDLDLQPLFPATKATCLNIEDAFCKGCSSLRTVSLLPSSLPMTVESEFLADCRALTSVNLEFFRTNGQTELPDFFLRECRSLVVVDLSPLQRITSIGDAVFAECTSLELLDLSPLEALASIGDNFGCGCRALKSVVLPNGNNGSQTLSFVGEGFINNCISLETIDLTPLASMTTVPNMFLTGCTGIGHLDLTPLAPVASIGSRFLNNLKSIKSVHLPFTTALTTIGEMFLSGCDALETVTMGSEFEATPSVSTVGMGFLALCKALTAINLRFLANVTHIGDEFLRGCVSLTTLDTTPLGNIQHLGEGFMQGCVGLEEVDVGFLTKVPTIPSRLLRSCSALRRIHNLDAAVANVKRIGHHFLRGCSSLEVVHLSCTLDGVEEIGGHFLAECTSLKSVLMPTHMGQLKSIDKRFLFGNKALTELCLPCAPPPPHPSLSVGKGFLSECTSLTAVDLRFLVNASLGEMLEGCSPNTLKAILYHPGKWTLRSQVGILTYLPEELRCNAIECGKSEEGSAAAVPQLQWSWKHHARHPKGMQLAVLWMFGGLQYKLAATDESRCLPAEVSYEICRYIGSPVTELLGSVAPPHSNTLFSFKKQKTDGNLFAAKKPRFEDQS